MLQRLLQIRFDTKIYNSRHTNILFRVPFQSQSCHCGVRLYSGRKAFWLRTSAETGPFKSGISCMKVRTLATQVDTQKKETSVKPLNNKTALDADKKINVKLKTSELKRLFNLAAPEKWNLSGKYTTQNCTTLIYVIIHYWERLLPTNFVTCSCGYILVRFFKSSCNLFCQGRIWQVIFNGNLISAITKK